MTVRNKDEDEKALTALEERLGYCFKDRSLLRLALTHHSADGAHAVDKNNERLEFLGDAVLYLLIGDTVYEEFPRATVAQLSEARVSVVRGSNLTAWGRSLGLGSLLQSASRPSASMVEDAFEALIGAMYVDCGRQKEPICRLLRRFSNFPSADRGGELAARMTEDAVAERLRMLTGTVPSRLRRFLDDERNLLAVKVQSLLSDEVKRRKDSRRLSVKCTPGLGDSSNVYFAKVRAGADFVASASALSPQDARLFALVRTADIWNCWNPVLSSLGILNVTGLALAAKTLSPELLNSTAAARGLPRLHFDTSVAHKHGGPPLITLAAHTDGTLALRLEGFDGRILTQAAVLTLLWRLVRKKTLLPELPHLSAAQPYSVHDTQLPDRRSIAPLRRVWEAFTGRFRQIFSKKEDEPLTTTPPDALQPTPPTPLTKTAPKSKKTSFPAPATLPPNVLALPLSELFDGDPFVENYTGKND